MGDALFFNITGAILFQDMKSSVVNGENTYSFGGVNEEYKVAMVKDNILWASKGGGWYYAAIAVRNTDGNMLTLEDFRTE